MATPLHVEIEHRRGEIVVVVDGELDAAGSVLVSEALGEVVRDHRSGDHHEPGADPPVRVVVDLAETSFLDSTGVRALMRAQASVEGSGLQFRLRHARPSIRQVLELAQLATWFGLER